MQNFKSGLPSEAVLSELKNILELISNPKDLKEALKELSNSLDELNKAKLELAKESTHVKSNIETLHKLNVELDQSRKDFEEKEKQHSEVVSKFNRSDAEIHAKNKKLQDEKDEFEKLRKDVLDDLSHKSFLMEQAIKNANELAQKSEAIKKEFEEKLEKFKSLAGV